MVSKDYHIGDILRALTELDVNDDDDDDAKAPVVPSKEQQASVLDVLDEVVDTLDA